MKRPGCLLRFVREDLSSYAFALAFDLSPAELRRSRFVPMSTGNARCYDCWRCPRQQSGPRVIGLRQFGIGSGSDVSDRRPISVRESFLNRLDADCAIAL